MDVEQIGPDSYGMSESVLGSPAPGELVVVPDDNVTNPVTAGVKLGYHVPHFRTGGWVMMRTGHIYEIGSNDLGTGAGADSSGGDDEHPQPTTIQTGTTTTGHVGFTSCGGVNSTVFSATSHLRICDFNFMLPILPDGTDSFRSRFGFANVTFGAAAHAAYMQYDEAAATAKLITRAASVETSVDSGVTIVAGQYYRGRIVVTNNATVDLYLAEDDAAWPTTPTCSSSTNIPSGTGQGVTLTGLVEKTAGTNNRELAILYCLYALDRLG